MHRLRTLVLALVVGAAFLALAGPATGLGCHQTRLWEVAHTTERTVDWGVPGVRER